MIDIHHHLIYGVDDGPPDLETSLGMAREAAREGVIRIVCTPHASEQFPYREALIEERFKELRHLLDGEIDLSLGCDFHMTPENVDGAVSRPLHYSIDGKGYLLIEFPSMVIPPGMDEAIVELRSAGYTIAITHPERYPAVLQKPDLLAGWLRSGCLVQVTAASLYGRFGQAAEAFSNELLERNWIHFIASDAHSLDRRPPHLKKSFDYVASRAGLETARRLFLTNPQAAINGAPLPAQPEAIGLFEEVHLRFDARRYAATQKPASGNKPGASQAQPASRAKGLWMRLFSR